MRIFLAPLYPTQSFCKHCMRRLKAENPDYWFWRYELKPMPPLGASRAPAGHCIS